MEWRWWEGVEGKSAVGRWCVMFTSEPSWSGETAASVPRLMKPRLVGDSELIPYFSPS